MLCSSFFVHSRATKCWPALVTQCTASFAPTPIVHRTRMQPSHSCNECVQLACMQGPSYQVHSLQHTQLMLQALPDIRRDHGIEWASDPLIAQLPQVPSLTLTIWDDKEQSIAVKELGNMSLPEFAKLCSESPSFTHQVSCRVSCLSMHSMYCSRCAARAVVNAFESLIMLLHVGSVTQTDHSKWCTPLA